MALHPNLRHALKNRPPSRSDQPRLLARSGRWPVEDATFTGEQSGEVGSSAPGLSICDPLNSEDARVSAVFRRLMTPKGYSKRVFQKGSSCTMHAVLFHRLTQNGQVSSLLPPSQRRRHPLAYYASQVASGKPHTTTRPCIFCTLTVHASNAGRGDWRLIEGRGGLMVFPVHPICHSQLPRLPGSYPPIANMIGHEIRTYYSYRWFLRVRVLLGQTTPVDPPPSFRPLAFVSCTTARQH